MPRRKKTANPNWRQDQVKTVRKNQGRDFYKRIGAKGGGNKSPGSFTSESARRAGILSGQARARKRREAAEGGEDA